MFNVQQAIFNYNKLVNYKILKKAFPKRCTLKNKLIRLRGQNNLQYTCKIPQNDQISYKVDH